MMYERSYIAAIYSNAFDVNEVKNIESKRLRLIVLDSYATTILKN